MLKEFQKFLMRGNVIDLAVGVIIGAAFSSIVTSLVDDIIGPIIGLLTGITEVRAAAEAWLLWPALLPLVVYFGSGRWFVRGIAAGAVKG